MVSRFFLIFYLLSLLTEQWCVKEKVNAWFVFFRSCEFQNDYERLKAELVKAEEDAATNLNKRRGIALEKREAKMEKDEAERYQVMKDELVSIFPLVLIFCFCILVELEKFLFLVYS